MGNLSDTSLLTASFTDQHELSIDAKGRVPVPAAFRKVLRALEQDVLPLGLGPNGDCLRGYTEHGFGQLMNRIEEAAQGSQQERALAALIRREVMGNMAMLAVDGQGRILIPGGLRAAGGLDGECVFVGSGIYFELWSRTGWEAEKRRVAESLAGSREAKLAIYG